MVDMAVGQQDLLDRDSGLRRRRLEPRQVAARIDERAAHRLGAPDQRAILLQRRHRNDRRAQRRLAHFHGSAGRGCEVAIAGGSFFIEAATASAWRITRSTLPPASLARFCVAPAAADQLGEDQGITGDAVQARRALRLSDARRDRRRYRHGRSPRPWRHGRYDRRPARPSRPAPDGRLSTLSSPRRACPGWPGRVI